MKYVYILLAALLLILPAGSRAQTTPETWYRKGNLVPNPGFEQGLTGWTVIGKDVTLTDGTGGENREVRRGLHSLRVSRPKADVSEVDAASQGVLSDYIPVAPGNYNFDFDIRLKNIYPAVERFQQRIGKGIDIHLEFYDKDKKRISPGYYFEYLGKEVDNGFKGFAFSNFFYIDSFPWARVNGRSWNYPYSEGDVPVDCRYIRIFAGLACSGDLWIDDIDFRMSKYSFTPEERMDSFFHREYAPYQLLIPTPRWVGGEKRMSLGKHGVRLFYGGSASVETDRALELLGRRFAGALRDRRKVVVSRQTPAGAAGDRLEVVLLPMGDTTRSSWPEAFAKIADKEQGYFIRRKGRRIYIGANRPQGLYYGVTTLCQLIDSAGAALDYVDVTDYPDFTARTATLVGYQNDWEINQTPGLTDSMRQARIAERARNLGQQVKDIDFYAFYKINQFYDNYFQLSKRWWMPGDFYTTYYKTIGERCAQYGGIVSMAVQVNPYFHINMEQRVDTLSDSLVHIFAHGTEDGFQKILAVLRPALDAGARTVMVCADDYVPHLGTPRSEYTLFNPVDEAQFTNLAGAQNYLLNKLKVWLDSAYGPVRLEFVPPQYNNYFLDYTRGTGEAYFHDLMNHLNPDIVIVWTGNTIRSMAYDAADILRFTNEIHRKPMVWDNSPYAHIVESANGGYPANYPEKSILCNLVEPFDIRYPEDFPAYLDGHYYSNLGGFGELNKIKNLTFVDFSWNCRDYNPEFSLYKALVRSIGRENGRLLLRFNAAYYRFVAVWGKVRREKTHRPDYRCSADELRQAAETEAQMEAAFRALEGMDNQALVRQLSENMEAKKKSWQQLTRS